MHANSLPNNLNANLFALHMQTVCQTVCQTIPSKHFRANTSEEANNSEQTIPSKQFRANTSEEANNSERTILSKWLRRRRRRRRRGWWRGGRRWLRRWRCCREQRSCPRRRWAGGVETKGTCSMHRKGCDCQSPGGAARRGLRIATGLIGSSCARRCKNAPSLNLARHDDVGDARLDHLSRRASAQRDRARVTRKESPAAWPRALGSHLYERATWASQLLHPARAASFDQLPPSCSR